MIMVSFLLTRVNILLGYWFLFQPRKSVLKKICMYKCLYTAIYIYIHIYIFINKYIYRQVLFLIFHINCHIRSVREKQDTCTTHAGAQYGSRAQPARGVPSVEGAGLERPRRCCSSRPKVAALQQLTIDLQHRRQYIA